MKHLDLFSGIGGFTLAMKRVFGKEYKNAGHSEIDKNACKIYHHHFKDSKCLRDITKISFSQQDSHVKTQVLQETEKDSQEQTMGGRGLCISTKCGERQDPASETFIAYTVGTTDFSGAIGSRSRNIIASTIQTNDNYRGNARTKRNFVANTIGAT